MLSLSEIEGAKSHMHALVDRVPPEQINAAVQILESLIVPPDNEPVTEEDRRRILECRAAIARGERGVSMEEVLADFGLTMDDFPAYR